MTCCKHCGLNISPYWGKFGWELIGWIDNDGFLKCKYNNGFHSESNK